MQDGVYLKNRGVLLKKKKRSAAGQFAVKYCIGQK
jgi:hypothetical protein